MHVGGKPRRAPTESKSKCSQMSVMVKMSEIVLRHLPLTLSISSRTGYLITFRLACWIYSIGMATWWSSTCDCASDVSPFHLRFPRFTARGLRLFGFVLFWGLVCLVLVSPCFVFASARDFLDY